MFNEYCLQLSTFTIIIIIISIIIIMIIAFFYHVYKKTKNKTYFYYTKNRLSSLTQSIKSVLFLAAPEDMNAYSVTLMYIFKINLPTQRMSV